MLYLPYLDEVITPKPCWTYPISQHERWTHQLEDALRREILILDLHAHPHYLTEIARRRAGFGTDTLQTRGPLRTQNSHDTRAGD